MNCELTQTALLDEALPRPEGFEAHVASCESCRALAASHREALRLRGVSLSRTRRRPMAEVRRRAGIVVGLTLALGGGLGLVALEFGDRAPAPAKQQQLVSLQPEVPAMVVEPEGDLFALAQLQAFVAADVAREPREDPTMVRAFGELPRWTAPRRTQPMRSLGRAASPVIYTSEDSP